MTQFFLCCRISKTELSEQANQNTLNFGKLPKPEI